MTKSIFYSWQSDSPSTTNRYFVRDCIKDAIKKLNGDQVLDEAVRLDHDTAGIPGTPDIANTIFGKISESAAFVADLTLCSESSSGKRSPNPNVLIELGYAFSEIGDARVISVMNTAFGEPGQLPFDLSHKRWPIQYKLEELAFDKKSVDFKSLKNQVTSEIYNAIRLVVAAIPQTAPQPYGPSSPPSFAYVENSILSSDPRADWEVISTDWDTTAISRKDVNLRLVVSSEDEGIQNADFKETWANCHPDQSATGYWCDIYYASTRVARNLLVSVDGARAMLPIPRQGGASGKVTEVLPFDHRLAQIFDTLGSLDSYMVRSGLTVAFTD